MKTLIELDIDLEGRLTLEGKKVWKAVPIGKPIIVDYASLVSEAWMAAPMGKSKIKPDFSVIAKRMAEYAPKTANAYTRGELKFGVKAMTVPVQYYKLSPAPQGPSTD